MPRRDPFKNFSFLVEIDGVAAAAFTSVSGLAAEAEVIEYRELGGPQLDQASGADPLPQRDPPARSHDLARPVELVADRPRRHHPAPHGPDRPPRRLRPAGAALALREAWPAKWELSELDASKNEVAIETLELAHEGLELVT